MNLIETRAALVEYDRSALTRQARWDEAKTDADVDDCWAADADAFVAVQEAFWRDCVREGIPNSREHCSEVGLVTLRDWAAKEAYDVLLQDA